MTPAARERFILDRLESSGACAYPALAEAIGVAEMTIRRDVDRLAKQGLVFKVLGGVQTASAPKHFYESELRERVRRNAAEKRAIATCALRRVEPQQTIFLDGGTTSLALAKILAAEDRAVNVVTNSTWVCLELGGARNVSVLSLGGKFDPASGCLVGPTCEELARRLFVDIAFFSTMGVVPGEGTFESNIAALRVKQIIGEQASKLILLVDHTKFGARALCKVLEISQLHEIITDDQTPAAMARELEQHGPRVTLADASAHAAEVSRSAS